MCSQARNHETWHNCKQRGQALEGRGSPGGQAWINNERRGASHSDAFTLPDGGFVVIKSTLGVLESHGRFHDNEMHLPATVFVFNLH